MRGNLGRWALAHRVPPPHARLGRQRGPDNRSRDDPEFKDAAFVRPPREMRLGWACVFFKFGVPQDESGDAPPRSPRACV
jgi:hypothetical protein